MCGGVWVVFKKGVDLLDPRFILKRSQNAYMAFNKTYAVLNDALNEMIEDMTEVLRVAGLDQLKQTGTTNRWTTGQKVLIKKYSTPGHNKH